MRKLIAISCIVAFGGIAGMHASAAQNTPHAPSKVDSAQPKPVDMPNADWFAHAIEKILTGDPEQAPPHSVTQGRSTNH